MTNTLISTASTDLSPLQAVIFDWAGTLVDFGSLAPTQIFVEAFASFGITITLAQARGPMGLSKWQHIHELLQDEGIRAQWHKAFGQPPADADVDAIYARFMPMQIAKVGEFSAPIDGAPELLGWLRAQGLKVGSCSGYPREVLNQLLPQAAANGLAPDHVVAGDEMAAGGRPGPFMALANVLALGIGDVRASRSSSASAQGSRRTKPGLTDGARFALRNAEDQEPTATGQPRAVYGTRNVRAPQSRVVGNAHPG
jgi:phosphonoacetaldehyde hydrolase